MISALVRRWRERHRHKWVPIRVLHGEIQDQWLFSSGGPIGTEVYSLCECGGRKKKLIEGYWTLDDLVAK